MLFGRHYVSPLPTWDDIPITKVADNYIQFGNPALSNPYWEGELDRFTVELTIFHRAFGDTEKYYLQCKPAKPLLLSQKPSFTWHGPISPAAAKFRLKGSSSG
jgi:hypothetical protein